MIKVWTFLPKSQSGFRQHRSTSDAVWTHKWMIARIMKVREEILILGIDMSRAFDTIDRALLLAELRAIRQLENHQIAPVRHEARSKTSKRPVSALQNQHRGPTRRLSQSSPLCHLLGTGYEVFGYLAMNCDKTELTTLKRVKEKEDETWRKTKKLGTRLGDMRRRKQLASVAYENMMRIWGKKNKIWPEKRIMLYNTYTTPILTYNSCTWALT